MCISLGFVVYTRYFLHKLKTECKKLKNIVVDKYWMQFKRSGEFTKKEREKFQRNVYLDESSAPMAASIKQKTKKATFGGLALQFIY